MHLKIVKKEKVLEVTIYPLSSIFNLTPIKLV